MNGETMASRIEEIAKDLQGVRILATGLAALADYSEIDPPALDTLAALVAKAEDRLRAIVAEHEGDAP